MMKSLYTSDYCCYYASLLRRLLSWYRSVASALPLPLESSVYLSILRRLWRYQNVAEKQVEYGFARERREGWKGTAGETAINPARQQGQMDAERELLNACERVVTRKSSVS